MKGILRFVNKLLIIFPGVLFSQGVLRAEAAESIGTDSIIKVTTVPEGNAININWSTSSETNSDYFIVQRSQDGVLFDDVMQEIAAGNSSTLNKYSITDYKPYTGTSFYRVVEVDADGKFTHINSTVANFETELSMNVYPGSSANTFSVSITGKVQKQVLLVVRDMQGIEYYSKVIILRSVDEIVAIEPEGKLPQGIYTIVASSNNSIYSKKVIITK
jgi:hypothetical protein